jgi:hypothetical protein
VPSAHQIAVVDRQKGSVVAAWDLGDVRANFPMALDEIGHRLFVATRRPAAVVVYDTVSGRRVANIASCADADDVFYDGKGGHLYVICGEGVSRVIRRQDADHYELRGQVLTRRGARTGLFVPSQGMLYVAVPAQGSAPAEVRAYVAK